MKLVTKVCSFMELKVQKANEAPPEVGEKEIGRLGPSHVVAAIRHRPSKVPHLNENAVAHSCIAHTCSSRGGDLELCHTPKYLCAYRAKVFVCIQRKYLCAYRAYWGDLRESEGTGHSCWQSGPSFLHQQSGAAQKFGPPKPLGHQMLTNGTIQNTVYKRIRHWILFIFISMKLPLGPTDYLLCACREVCME